jgi:NAD(P)-dependent dehydrogenase (short-subunit alcohol dehydrogenase family)
MPRRTSLNGKVVLVTGAARGIGAESARLAARKGAKVMLAGLEPELLEQVAGELGAQHAWVECDVTDDASVQATVEATVERFGGIDVVLANAGVASNGTVATTPLDVLLRVNEVNLNGAIRTVHAALPHITARRGYVMITASAAAFSGLPGMSTYCSSKAGIEHFANILRLEIAHKGVDVGTIHPTWIDTDLVRDQKAESKLFADAIAKLPGPAGAYTSVEDCAAAIIDGMERRKRKVYVPKGVVGMAVLKSFINSAAGDWVVRQQSKKMVPQLEAESKGRTSYFGRTSVGMGTPKDPVA